MTTAPQNTLAMLEAVIARLQLRIPRVVVEYFPEKPSTYRLNHPLGALLVGYGGSRYGQTQLPDAIMQDRDVAITVTIVMRQLNGRDGAVQLLDETRAALLGCRLPGTTAGLRAIKDDFLGEVVGLWQYAIDFAAPKLEIEDIEDTDDDAPLLRHVTRLGPLDRTETEKQPDGTITEEDHPL